MVVLIITKWLGGFDTLISTNEGCCRFLQDKNENQSSIVEIIFSFSSFCDF